MAYLGLRSRGGAGNRESSGDLPKLGPRPGTARLATRLRLSRTTCAGLAIALLSLLLFSATLLLLTAHLPPPPHAAAPVALPRQPFANAQKLSLAPFGLIVLTIGSGLGAVRLGLGLPVAACIGFFGAILLRRGWTPLQAGLACGLLATHPLILFLATSGGNLGIAIVTMAGAVLALDRIEAIGDTQATILFGIALACALALGPDAVYGAGLLMLVLPLASRDMRGGASAMAIVLIAALPSVILILSSLLASALFGLPASEIWGAWWAPLHGLAPAGSLPPWLERFGGAFLPAFATLMLLCLLGTGPLALILLRLIADPREQQRPVTAAVALCLPATSGALMAAAWHLPSPLGPMALALAVTLVWTMTVQLGRQGRWLWLFLLALSVVTLWAVPQLLEDPAFAAWRCSLTGLG
ncbi:hypothetical protein [Acidisoma sp. C75]